MEEKEIIIRDGIEYILVNRLDMQTIHDYQKRLKKDNDKYENTLKLIANEPDNFSKSGYIKIKGLAKNALDT